MNRLNSDDWFYIALIASIIVVGACNMAHIALSSQIKQEPTRFFVIIDGKILEMEEKKEWKKK